MERQIEVGDLVVMIRPSLCCWSISKLGRIFKVISDTDRLRFKTCPVCRHTNEHSALTTVRLDTGAYCERIRLKRIPPLSELETERTDTEETA